MQYAPLYKQLLKTLYVKSTKWTYSFFAMMTNYSRLLLSSALLCSLFSANATSELATNTISTKESVKFRRGDSFVGSATTSHQLLQNQTCFPRSWNELVELKVIVAPNNNCSPVEVLQCYCVTLESKSSDMDNDSLQDLNLGKCFYGCFISSTYHHVELGEQFDKGMCAQFNRKGILCSQCKDGYGPAVYSFSLKCVECNNSTHWTRVSLYILVAYGPLTVFLAIIVLFTVSVNSAPLHGWILVCQLLSTNSLMRVICAIHQRTPNNSYILFIRILESIYGMWNLDFFRSLYPPFCLNSSLTTLQVMSLDYIIAAYPIVLIVVMYFLVDMYSRNYKLVVFVLRPLHYCFTRFRHQLNIRTSLVDAFGTFFNLSYVKCFSTTFDLVISTKVWNFSGYSLRVYYDGTMEAFKDQHIPYVVVGVLVLLLCNILPIILILLYSFRRTHAILNYLPLSIQTMLFPFMDNILACYKDGTNGTRNCRYFGVVYPLAFIGVLCGYALTKSIFIAGVNTFMCIVIGMSVAVIQPYKSKVYNIVDTVLILSVGLSFAACMCLWIGMFVDPQNTEYANVITIIPVIIPLLYIGGYLASKMGKRYFQSLYYTYIKVKAILSQKRIGRLSEMGSISENTGLVQ